MTALFAFQPDKLPWWAEGILYIGGTTAGSGILISVAAFLWNAIAALWNEEHLRKEIKELREVEKELHRKKKDEAVVATLKQLLNKWGEAAARRKLALDACRKSFVQAIDYVASLPIPDTEREVLRQIAHERLSQSVAPLLGRSEKPRGAGTVSVGPPARVTARRRIS